MSLRFGLSHWCCKSFLSVGVEYTGGITLYYRASHSGGVHFRPHFADHPERGVYYRPYRAAVSGEIIKAL